MKNNFDVIIIGAGSVGTPTAYFLSEKGFKVAVIEKEHSPGRGQNRAAIGGIRATHSVFSKIKIAQDSINVFSNWKEKTGEEIDWYQGGYIYPIYTEEDKKNVMELLKRQKSFGLEIDWISKEEVIEILNDIDSNGLLGGIYSPYDGNASPLKSIFSFYNQAVRNNVKFYFEHTAIEFLMDNNEQIIGVKTDKGEFFSKYVINSTGVNLRDLNKNIKIEIPLNPDCHEAGITEPVSRMFDPLVVDIRGMETSKNIYFYQTPEGQICFCLTPNPAIYCNNLNSTTDFLLNISARLVKIFPEFSKLRIRRIWRGYYPMTPDGLPIVELINKSYLIVGGMCGQGFMLGPGFGKLITRILSDNITEQDMKILKELSLYRNFNNVEFYK